MPRYGGGLENYKEQQALLGEMESRLVRIEAKETATTAATEDLGTATDQVATKRRVLNKAKAEGVDIGEREVAVIGQETAALDVSTAAIERNRLAREQRAAAALKENIDFNRALRGAQDPLFAQVYATGPNSQYGMRRDLGIGQGRAQRLQEALYSGIRPASDVGVIGSQTRVQAAESAIVRADIGLVAAKRAYTAAVKAGDQAAAEDAAAARRAAEAAVAASKLELESAQKMAASADEVVAARRAASIATSREAELRAVHGGTRGELIVRDPTGSLAGAGILPRTGPDAQPYWGVRTGKEAVNPGIAASMAARKASNELAAAHLTASHAAAQEVEQTTLLNESRQAAAVAGEQVAARSAASAAALRAEGVALGTVSQAMHKHGALTQEFILAAARGETTLKELGNQALVTAGKFGGWTAAAAGVYGLARAIGQVGHGAIAAQSGVTGLERFIPNLNRDQAISDLQRVAGEVNVPIDEVAQTQQVFARVFSNQRDSITATSTALKAYQLDQVDAAQSARYFTAIVQEGEVPAQRLPLLFDQISRAQRVMGARVQENLPAIARSLAAVKNAGGDLNQLIALTTVAQTASGQTGNVVGTAFSRAASNFYKQPANQEVIRSLGIDPDQGFTQLLIDAVHKTKDLSGADRTALARAIGGPQFGGRVFQALLGQGDRLNKALKETSPEASRGSAEEELHKRLQQTDQQIKAIGLSLQRLGAELSRSGVFTIFGLMLHGINDVLDLAVKVVSVFNGLPAPIRQGVTLMGELVLMMKLLQRFGATERLAGGPLGFLAAPDRQFAARAKRGLRDARDAARDESERAGMRSYRISSAAARAQVAAEEAAVAATEAQRVGTAQQQIEANIKLVDANELANRLQKEALAAEQDAARERLLTAAATEEYTAAARMDSKALAAHVRANMIPTPAETGVPSSAGLAGSTEAEVVAAQKEAEALASRRALTGVGQATEDGLMRYYASFGAGIQSLTREQVRLGGVGRALDSAARGGISVAARATSTVERAALRVKGLGGGLGSFLKGLGPLDIALVSYFALDAIGSSLEKGQQKLEQQAKDRQKDPQTAAGMAKYRATLKQQAQFHAVTNADAWDDFKALANPLNLIGDITGLGGYMSPTEQKFADRLDAKRQGKLLDDITKHQKYERSHGLAEVGLTFDQLSKNVDRDQQSLEAGLISRREFIRRMVLHTKETGFLYFPTRESIQKARASIADAERVSGGEGQYAASLKGLDPQHLATQATAIATQLKDFGTSRRELRRLALVYDAQVSKLSASDSAEALQALSEARNQYFDTIRNAAEYDLQSSLAEAGSESARQEAFTQAARFTATGLVGRARKQLADARGRLASARSHAQQARAALRAGLPHYNLGQLPGEDTGIDPFGLTYTADGSLEALRDEAIKDAARVRKLEVQRSKTRKELKAAIKANHDAQIELAQAAFDDREQGRQIDLALAQSETNDPVVAAQDALTTARQGLADARASGGKDRARRIKTALTNVNNANKAIGDAVKQKSDQARQDAQALRDARFDYLESLTTDPVAQAHIETQKARADIQGTKGADRFTAKANLNRALQAERDARLSAREGDIDFEKEMGRITNQDAISRYQELLKIKSLTKQQRRDILEKIHGLKSESESEASGFDLDVGSIRLPTLYDVRKAWDPIRRRARENQHAIRAADIRSNVSHMYDARAHVQANVHVVVNDKNAAGEVFKAIDRALGTTVRAQLRSHGMRG